MGAEYVNERTKKCKVAADLNVHKFNYFPISINILI